MSTPSAIYSASECLPARGTGQKLAVRMTSNLSVIHGQLLVAEPSAMVSEVQSLASTGSPTGGSFQLSFNGQVTASLPWAATSVQVQAALQGLANIGPGNVLCTAGPVGGAPVVITFSGELANLPQPLLVVSYAALTGGTSPTIATARTTAGVGYMRFKLYTGTGSPVICQYDIRTDERGRIVKGQSVTPQFGYDPDTAAWIGGIFRNGDLVGLDAAAVTNMGARWVTGSLADPNSLLIIPGAQ